MLVELSIRNLVLIERATVTFENALVVLTGETGAGKSILLDGLGLALGKRAEAGLVRDGTDQAVAVARFEPGDRHPIFGMLEEHGIDADDGNGVTLKRTLQAKGGSRAFINDQPVSAKLLQDVGTRLVEIHGQNDGQGLLDQTNHLDLLDVYGGHEEQIASFSAAMADWRNARKGLEAAKAALAALISDQEWLQHAVEELSALNLRPGEESELSDARARMLKGEQLSDSIAQIEKLLSSRDGALSLLRQTARLVGQLATESAQFATILESIDRALIEGDRMEDALRDLRDGFAYSREDLEATEARLFDIRAMARKHRVTPEELSPLATELEERLSSISLSEDRLDTLRHKEQETHAAVLEEATKLTAARHQAAERLQKAVQKELPSLKLEHAHFHVEITETALGRNGRDEVGFLIATNHSENPGPLSAIASGGELSRIALALKVALTDAASGKTLIFDEIDQGVGGATATAIGTRLARLSASTQVVVVTHSPQIAAAARQHHKIEKVARHSTIRLLEEQERLEEIGRMLSGSETTDEARAQAERLVADYRG